MLAHLFRLIGMAQKLQHDAQLDERLTECSVERRRCSHVAAREIEPAQLKIRTTAL